MRHSRSLAILVIFLTLGIVGCEESPTDLADLGPGSVEGSAKKGGGGAGTFTVVDLGTLPAPSRREGFANATHLNDANEVVGLSRAADGRIHAFHWSGGLMTDLGVGGASGISGDGQRVAGSRNPSATTSEEPPRAVVWERQGSGWSEAELPSNGLPSRAAAINRRGDFVTGHLFPDYPSSFHSVAAVWQLSGADWVLTVLAPTNSVAGQVNDAGEIAGSVNGQAVAWTRGGGGWTMTALGPLPDTVGSQAGGINEAGDVVGSSRNAAFDVRPVLWKRIGGTAWEPPVDLGSLGGPSFVGGFLLAQGADDVNDRGQVVGTTTVPNQTVPQHGFLWTQAGGMIDLGTYKGERTHAHAINEYNRIVGTNGSRAIMWILN